MAGLGTRSRPWGLNRIKTAIFTVAAEAANVIKVTCALKGDRRKAAGRCAVRCWLTQNATTKVVAAVAPSGTVVVAAKGAIIVSPTAKLVHDVVTDANGEFDLNVTDATAGNWYLCVQLPDGAVAVSGVLDFRQPAVTSTAPTGGTTAGGDAVTITGTGFTGATGVDFGGAAATSVVVVSDTSITCVSPARTAGAKAVSVTTPYGTSNTDVTFLYA